MVSLKKTKLKGIVVRSSCRAVCAVLAGSAGWCSRRPQQNRKRLMQYVPAAVTGVGETFWYTELRQVSILFVNLGVSADVFLRIVQGGGTRYGQESQTRRA